MDPVASQPMLARRFKSATERFEALDPVAIELPRIFDDLVGTA